MTIKNALLAGAVLLLSIVKLDGANVAAADPIPMSHDWSGVYLGVHAGGAWGDVDYGRGSAAGPGPDNDFDISGFLGGGLIGVNFQNGQWVYGLEGDVSGGTLDGNRGFVGDFDIEAIGTIRGRAGYAMDQYLLFVTAGVGFAGGDSTEPTSGQDSNTHVGFVIGAGLEWAVTEQISFRGEYQFGTYGSEKYRFPLAVPHFHKVDFDTHVVRAALIWNFGPIFWP